MTWQPLSVRRGLKPPTALQGGVPAHLLPHVLGWISKSLGGESNAGAMARRANISYVALLNHIQVRDSGDSLDALNTILLQCRLDQDLCLDVLDCLLRFELGDAEDLDLLLAVGASTWKVAPDRRSLTSRVDPTVEEALSAATSPEDAASAELREAWTRAYGRERDPSDAWDHAIKAVEALLRPIVSPRTRGQRSARCSAHYAPSRASGSSRWRATSGAVWRRSPTCLSSSGPTRIDTGDRAPLQRNSRPRPLCRPQFLPCSGCGQAPWEWSPEVLRRGLQHIRVADRHDVFATTSPLVERLS